MCSINGIYSLEGILNQNDIKISRKVKNQLIYRDQMSMVNILIINVV
jgi:hypothetical protein